MRHFSIWILVILALSLPTAPLPTEAQQADRIPRVGFLDPSTQASPYFAGFREGLRWLGHVEGQTIALEPRFAQGKIERLADFATELVRLDVEVIVAVGGASVQAAQRATTTIPIVMGFSGDPVQAGFVKSYARPGANITGLSWFSSELAGKRLELLKQVVPALSRVAVMSNPDHPGEQIDWRETQIAADKLRLELEYIVVRKPVDISKAFAQIAKMRTDALLVIPEALTLIHRRQIAAFAIEHRLPMVAAWTVYTRAGGLMSYGPNLGHQFRRLAALVDKVLRGVQPEDLPVERPVRFDLVLNLATAKALGLTLPEILLFQADEVIP